MERSTSTERAGDPAVTVPCAATRQVGRACEPAHLAVSIGSIIPSTACWLSAGVERAPSVRRSVLDLVAIYT
jgi:hypothetical protein